MEKAYDLKELGNVLKGKGLDVAEESLNILFDSVVEWVEESAKISATPYDDMAMLVMPQLKKLVKEAIDKIDGEKDNE